MTGYDIPTLWQRAIFRNYGTVSIENLAKVLRMDVSMVIHHAKLLGLEKLEYDENWAKKGFVTLIRNNWDLLRLEDIAVLLDLSQAAIRALLADYDFLDVKLGKKPVTSKLRYAPLTTEETRRTEAIGAYVRQYARPYVKKPFDFFTDNAVKTYGLPQHYAVKERFTSCYCADYSNTLLDDMLADYADDYLERLAATGVNGIWLQETLRNLAAFPFDPSLRSDFETRVRNLDKLTRRCESHGIYVYLYLNEPRSLPDAFFEAHPQLKGQSVGDGQSCLCTSTPQVQTYLYEAVKFIAERVPKLRGVMTITMSENPTHCFSRTWSGLESGTTECPHCADKAPEEVAAAVNNLVARALKDGNGYTKLIANLWGWSPFMGWDEDRILRGITRLDQDIEVMCVSEFGKKFMRGGVESEVIDYSISEVGPSDITQKMLTQAAAAGHRIWAKIQLNNSWECSAVPYIPVFDLMLKHIANLRAIGVDGLMMGWSLGGYPGGALPICCMACGEDDLSEQSFYQSVYGDCADVAKRAVSLFCDAFKKYPFSLSSLYYGAHNMGCGNLWSLAPDGRVSTMVCFTFDDHEKWAQPYGLDTYTMLFDELTRGWLLGINELKRCQGNEAYEELKRVAWTCYIHFRSAYLHAVFVKYKGAPKTHAKILLDAVRQELALTERLIELIRMDAKIGFEMTNHYYYHVNLLLEKMLNLQSIEKRLQNI